MSSYQYRKSHCGDKTILRSSHLHHGISYTGKITHLYLIGALKVFCFCFFCFVLFFYGTNWHRAANNGQQVPELQKKYLTHRLNNMLFIQKLTRDFEATPGLHGLFAGGAFVMSTPSNLTHFYVLRIDITLFTVQATYWEFKESNIITSAVIGLELYPSRLEQNDWHFAYVIFRCLHLKQNCCISILTSMKFLP